MTDLKIFSGIINTTLLNEIIAFVLDTAGAGYAQRKELESRCLFYDNEASGDTLQEKYGFLYLGELLERYEERFGMVPPDLRAIALALGYTRDLLTDGMFVGPQRVNFLRQLQGHREGDIYIEGALRLLEGGTAGLMGWPFARTEELLFAMSLQPDFSQAAQHLKSQLSVLLGKGRTMPILGNTGLLNWLTVHAAPVIKTLKGKDFTLLRALSALPTSYVKSGSRNHGLMLDHGWTSFEIAWANAVLALKQKIINLQGITAEKIVVELFQQVLAHGEPLTEEEYASLSELYREYQRFHIKCYGCERLEDTLRESVIQEPATFAWFGQLVDIGHPAFSGFDILDTKWDSLANTLPKYKALFELNLNTDMPPEDIQARVQRYDSITGQDYLSTCMEDRYSGRFGLMVSKGLIDLWECFRDSLDDEGNITQPDSMRNVLGYLKGLRSIQAYQFYQKFFLEYGMADLEHFFGWDHRYFKESLVKQRYSYSNAESLCLKRDFLDDDGHRQLLDWLQDYYFTYEPDKYAGLVVLVLRNEFASALLSHEERLALFNLAITHKDLVRSCEGELKRRYMTEAELKAEQDAWAAAELEAERQRQAAEVQAIRDEVDSANGSLKAIYGTLDSYRYRQGKLTAACKIVRDKLPGIMEKQGYRLGRTELAYYLKVCARLVDTDNMNLIELQDYISKLKELRADDDDNAICKAG